MSTEEFVNAILRTVDSSSSDSGTYYTVNRRGRGGEVVYTHHVSRDGEIQPIMTDEQIVNGLEHSELIDEDNAIRVLSIEQIITDLKSGITRLSSDEHYNSELGSIQEKYNLSPEEVTILFRHPKLKGVRVKKATPLASIIIQDGEESLSLTQIKAKYGKPSASAASRLTKNKDADNNKHEKE